MTEHGYRPSLPPVLAKARGLLQDALAPYWGQRVLVACSGGTDSLALAATVAFFAQRGDFPAGAVVVDHGLQPDSSQVAQRAATQLEGLGLAPTQIVKVTVPESSTGLEAAARQVRYQALERCAEQFAASLVLIAHTQDDQAEQVLLGLARGSGTRSLAGMAPERLFSDGKEGRYLRPFLGLSRYETAEICQLLELDPWHDPSNTDPRFTRVRAREQILPLMEVELGPGIIPALARSAEVLRHDADYLDQITEQSWQKLAQVSSSESVSFSIASLRELPESIRYRLFARAVRYLGGEQPSHERILAVDGLVLPPTGGGELTSGTVQLAGKVQARRQRDPQSQGSMPEHGNMSRKNYAKLVLERFNSSHVI